MFKYLIYVEDGSTPLELEWEASSLREKDVILIKTEYLDEEVYVLHVDDALREAICITREEKVWPNTDSEHEKLRNTYLKAHKSNEKYETLKDNLILETAGRIPFLASILPTILTPILVRRREQLLRRFGERLLRLETEGLDLQKLSHNEFFVDITIEIIQAAEKSHEREKLEYFLNGLTNVAMDEFPDETIVGIFVRLLDQFTLWHIRLLAFTENPELWLKQQNFKYSKENANQNISTIFNQLFPSLIDKPYFINLLFNDLTYAGLLRDFSTIGPNSLANRTLNFFMKEKVCSNLGMELLKFIRDPKQETN